MTEPKKQQDLMDWIAMSTKDTIVISEGNTGGIWEQVERLFLANKYRIGTQEARFINILNDVNSEDKLGKMLGANPNAVNYPLSDIPYSLWTYDMLLIHAEIQALVRQNDMLNTMLEQNKPSLLEG
tara:strand:+ start:1251 stop:1628 length:378 start_codon:yes stop_codon:yes gene_type:complete